jgi:hypothetical protein
MPPPKRKPLNGRAGAKVKPALTDQNSNMTKIFSVKTDYREHTGGTKAYRTWRLSFDNLHLVVGQWGSISQLSVSGNGGQIQVKHVSNLLTAAVAAERKLINEKVRGKSDGTYTLSVRNLADENVSKKLFASFDLDGPLKARNILMELFGSVHAETIIEYEPKIRGIAMDLFTSEANEYLTTDRTMPKPNAPPMDEPKSEEWGTW